MDLHRIPERETEPLFIVGCGRSGTTLVYELVSAHPDTNWISNYSDRHVAGAMLSRRPLRSASRLLATMTRRRAGVRPVEGYRTWDRLVGRGRDELLSSADLDADASGLNAMVRQHRRLAGGRVFVNKNTRNTRRVGYLAAAFPGARWLHVVRDPRAVALSLDRVAFWQSSPAWWRGNRTVGEEIADGADSFELAAECWLAEVTAAEDALGELDPECSMVLRYEELVSDPGAVLKGVAGFASLAPGPLLEAATAQSIDDRTAVALAKLSPAQLGIVRQNCSSAATRYGYEL